MHRGKIREAIWDAKSGLNGFDFGFVHKRTRLRNVARGKGLSGNWRGEIGFVWYKKVFCAQVAPGDMGGEVVVIQRGDERGGWGEVVGKMWTRVTLAHR